MAPRNALYKSLNQVIGLNGRSEYFEYWKINETPFNVRYSFYIVHL
jgi:hypothetical protein